MKASLHKVQISILDTLRHVESSKFSTLMQPTNLQSDTFKFHIRALVNSMLIRKVATGNYQLTPQGKELANNLSGSNMSRRRQPKLSVLVIVAKQQKDQNEPLYLFQERHRNPYYGFWSCIGGPILWGEATEDAGARELTKQTGLTAVCEVRTFYRKRDYSQAGELLEDKMFVILEATKVQGELTNSWQGGHNRWLTLADFKKQPKHFSSVYDAIFAIQNHQIYTSQEVTYSSDDY